MSDDERALQVIEDVLVRYGMACQPTSVFYANSEQSAREILSRLRMMGWQP